MANGSRPWRGRDGCDHILGEIIRVGDPPRDALRVFSPSKASLDDESVVCVVIVGVGRDVRCSICGATRHWYSDIGRCGEVRCDENNYI